MSYRLLTRQGLIILPIRLVQGLFKLKEVNP